MSVFSRAALVIVAVLVAGSHCSAEEPAASAEITVPESHPLVDAGELKLKVLDAEGLPELLEGALIYVNEKDASVPAGRLEFIVQREGVILLLASWEYDGNSGGDWKPEAQTREQLGETWIDLGKAPWDDKQVLFARQCKAGESFAIRTRKYNPPQPILFSQSRVAELQKGSSSLGEALIAELRGPPVEKPDMLAKLAEQFPEGAALLKVEGMQPSPLEGENIPTYLKGAMIYQRDKDRKYDSPVFGEVRFQVLRGGQVFLLASWKYDGNDDGDWRPTALSYQRLIDDWAPLGRCGWDPDYWLFVRECEAGKEYRVRTRKYNAPLPIVAAPVDLLSEEYADVVPVQLQERPVKMRIGQLLAAKDYAELERLAEEYRGPDSMFPSAHSRLAALYDTLSSVETYDNQHYTERIAELEAWVAADPESLTATVALARTLINYAFFARGEEFSNEVSERQFEVFHEQLNKADRVLEELGADAPRDAGYYAERIGIATGLGATRDDVQQWTLEAARLDPWNADAVYDAAMFFLPRWHGAAGDLVDLAEKLAEATRDECGEALYARVVMGVDNLVDMRVFVEDDFSWERTRQGLADLRERFPESWELLNAQCYLAIQAFDRELAAECFAEIGDEPNLKAWGRVDDYEVIRQAFSPQTLEGDQDRLWMVHTQGAKYACFSPDGKQILTSGHDSLIKVWDAATGKELRRQAVLGRFNRIDYLGDDTIVIGDTFGGVHFWKWEDDEIQLMTRMPQRVVSLDCSADGRYLYVADYFGNSFVVDLEKQQGVHRGEQDHGYFNTGAFATDSRYLATTGADGRIVLHNLDVGRPESTFAEDKAPKEEIAFSPDGKLIATGDESGFVKVWQIDGWKPIASTVEGGDRVRGLSFSPDGKQLAIARGGGLYFETGGVWILNVDEQALERRIPGHTMCVYDVDFAPDKPSLLSVGVDWTLRLYGTAIAQPQ